VTEVGNGMIIPAKSLAGCQAIAAIALIISPYLIPAYTILETDFADKSRIVGLFVMLPSVLLFDLAPYIPHFQFEIMPL